MKPKTNNQPEVKIDRRKRKTLAALRNSFTELMAEKSLDKITITEIAKRADIDRKTFYLHYDSLDDFVDEFITEEAERIALVLNEATIDETGNIDVYELFQLLGSELVLELDERAPIFAHTDTSKIIARLEPKLVQAIVEKDSLKIAEKLGLYIDVFVTFFCSGLLSVYRWWIENDSELPMEDLAAMVGTVITGGISALLIDFENNGQAPL